MVQLAPYLVADRIESYCTDRIDGDNVEAVFDPPELGEGIAFRRSIPVDLTTLLRELDEGFCPLNAIERSLSDLIDARESDIGRAHRRRRDGRGCDRDARAGRHPGRLHGQQVAAPRSVSCPAPTRRDVDANTLNDPARVRARDHVPLRPVVRVQRVLQVLQERRERPVQVHPDGASHVLRRQRHPRDGHRHHHAPTSTRRCRRGSTASGSATTFPTSPQSMDRFIDKIKEETHGEIIGELEIIRIPLNLYRARNATSRQWHTDGPVLPSVRELARVPRSATRRSARRTSSRSRWASSARCSWPGSSRSATCR